MSTMLKRRKPEELGKKASYFPQGEFLSTIRSKYETSFSSDETFPQKCIKDYDFSEVMDWYDSLADYTRDCVDHLCAASGFCIYSLFADVAKALDIQKVYDIGCATGVQEIMFSQKGINYCGIEKVKGELKIWKPNEVEYIFEAYPVRIKTKPNEMAVSSLCIGFLIEDEEAVLKQLHEDFAYAVMDTTPLFAAKAKRYFEVEELLEGVYLFIRKDI